MRLGVDVCHHSVLCICQDQRRCGYQCGRGCKLVCFIGDGHGPPLEESKEIIIHYLLIQIFCAEPVSDIFGNVTAWNSAEDTENALFDGGIL